MKIARRLEKERRNDEFLTQKMIETDSDLVMVRKWTVNAPLHRRAEKDKDECKYYTSLSSSF